MTDFISKLLEMAVSQGIWAVLYIYLFLRMLNENKAREDRYNATISRLSDNIVRGINHIQDQLDVILDNNDNQGNKTDKKEDRKSVV